MSLPLPIADIPPRPLWIIGTGPSLDLLDLSTIPEDAITITINAALALYASTYQVASDPEAIITYMRYTRPEITTWASRRLNRNLLPQEAAKVGAKYFIIDDCYTRGYQGSGQEAFALAYEISKRIPIESIHYVGVADGLVRPLSDMTIGYGYSYKLVDYLHERQRPLATKPETMREPYVVQWTDVRSYANQAKEITRLIHADPKFKRLLVSHSFADLTKMNGVSYDCGFREALRKL